MEDSVVIVEFHGDAVEVSRKPAVVASVDGVGAEIRQLEQASFRSGREQGRAGDVVERSPPPRPGGLQLPRQDASVFR